MVNLIILGATGAVGKQVITLLNENYAKYSNLRLLGSKKSEGICFNIRNENHYIQEANENSFINFDFAIFCVDSKISKKYAPIAIGSGCRVIDNSSAFRMLSDVPLIVPEINFNQFHPENYLIANPNCCTALLTMILYPLHRYNSIKEVQVSTYQSASGAGDAGMKELMKQAYDYINKKKMNMDVFGRQYLWNVFSHNSSINLENGYNEEELKIIEETKKILNNQSIDISATCVRVPVLRSHAESVSITFSNRISEEEIRMVLGSFPGVKLIDNRIDNIFPEPILSNYQDEVFVGRIRNRIGDNTSTRFELFISGDQLLKGAALNAVQIYNAICNNLYDSNSPIIEC